MIEFIINIFSFPFLFYAIAALIGTSFLAGTIGTYITINRFSYIAGALSHSILFGMGLFNYLKVIVNPKYPQFMAFLTPINGAFLSSIVFSIIIGILYNSKKERMDTILSAIWSIGMSAGILFIFLTPGYNQEITRYLFGNILLVSSQDLLFLYLFSFLIILIFSFFYKNILLIGFDNDFSYLMGQDVKKFNFIAIFIIGIAIVLMTQIVGIVLLIALLTLPSATILKFNLSFKKTIIFSCILTFIAGFFGLFLSYNFDLPSSPIIILFIGLIYISAFLKDKFKINRIMKNS